MKRQLVEMISQQTEIMLHNMRTAILTCDIEYILCGMPVWKHIYHTIHSCDRWFAGPSGPYSPPAFHRQGLNSLNIPTDITVSSEELLLYLDIVKKKTLLYLEGLSDDMLAKPPEGCGYTRMTLILGQLRHFNSHLGNINATTIIEAGRWPRVVGIKDSISGSLYQ